MTEPEPLAGEAMTEPEPRAGEAMIDTVGARRDDRPAERADGRRIADRRERAMKAIVFEKVGGPEVMAIADVAKPDVRPGMALIRVEAIGVNFADTRFRQGTYVATPKLPDTPGMEAAGVIEAVGD